MSRRASLAVIPQSNLNSRAPRQSLGPSRVSNADTMGLPMKSRMSLAPTSSGGRPSIGHAQPSRRSSIGPAPPR